MRPCVLFAMTTGLIEPDGTDLLQDDGLTDRNMENGKFCPQLNLYFNTQMAFRSKRTFRFC
jgi:hypothetical protein